MQDLSLDEQLISLSSTRTGSLDAPLPSTSPATDRPLSVVSVSSPNVSLRTAKGGETSRPAKPTIAKLEALEHSNKRVLAGKLSEIFRRVLRLLNEVSYFQTVRHRMINK